MSDDETQAPKRVQQKPRPGNSRDKHNERSREKIGQKVVDNYFAQHSKKLYPNGKPTEKPPRSNWSRNKQQGQKTENKTDKPPQELTTAVGLPELPLVISVKIVPFSSTGIGFMVNDLFFRLRRMIGQYVTIHQLYRFALAQLEMTIVITHESATGAYPSNNFDFQLNPALRAIKGYTENFSCVISAIEAYGRFSCNGINYCSVSPSHPTGTSPYFIRLSNLRQLVVALSADAVPGFATSNTIPGAIFDEDGILANPDEIMPAGYGAQQFRADGIAVRNAFDALKTKYNLLMSNCSYAAIGKAYTLVSTEKPRERIDHIPPILYEDIDPNRFQYPVPPGANENVQIAANGVEPTIAFERIYYSNDPVASSLFAFGILAYSGVFSVGMAAQYPDLQVRNVRGTVNRVSTNWNKIFAEVVPQLRKAQY